MQQTKKFIQIGCGGMGSDWVGVTMPRLIDELKMAEAAAVVDINPETFPLAQERCRLPAEKCYTDIDKAFAENKADFAIVVVPPACHEAVVNVALQHDMHVLSEKPIADTMEACCRIYKKVEQAGKKMAVTMSHRFDQDKQTLERRIKSGEYGKLDYLIGRNTWTCRKLCQWGRKFRYEMPDPLLIEGVVHHFDIVRSLTSSNARTVHAVTWNPAWSEFQGHAQGLILIEMENGVKVVYEGAKANATQLNKWSHDYWRAECEIATLELDNRKLRIMSDLDGERKTQDIPLDEQDVWTNAWLAELFVEWLRGGDPPPNNLDDNIQCAALLFAAIESAHTGRIVDVQEYLRQKMAETEP